MKKSLLTFLLLLIALSGNSQLIINCNELRYDQEIFSNVTITSNVVYGSNINNNGANTTLQMDIYEPAGDTVSSRPLIVWVHGGSFVGGSKLDNDVTQLSTAFAKRGYVCASIDYRLGITFPINRANATDAVFRAVQDMKAAVRFFRKDAATANQYRIDPAWIFGGGSSAGAFTALHLAYLDLPTELPASIDTTVLGGMEGNSGNPGYDSNIKAVINLCGALGDTAWLANADEPLCSMHGTNDNTVPYATDMLYLLGVFQIMEVDGSYSIHENAMTKNMEHTMYTFYGAGHVPFSSSSAYMDTTKRFVSNFLYRQLGCTPRNSFPLANTFNTVDVETLSEKDILLLYPNPASGNLTIELAKGSQKINWEILTNDGRMVLSGEEFTHGKLSVPIHNLSAGIYLIKINAGEKSYARLVGVTGY